MAGTKSHRLKGNLPAEVTSFVGRRREVAEAKRLLRRWRLLTLTGVAGVGKTRLALRVAGQMRETFPDGVWLVELAALTDDKLLTETVAGVFGIHVQSARPLMDGLADYLQDKQLLLVLDNCEHLVEACAMLVDELLAAAPGLRVLITSRQTLGSAGEHLLEVAPLPVTDLSQATRRLTRSPAVRLFIERATTALPGFKINGVDLETIARICERLDGIPLAIELAAVRVRGLSLQQILDRLHDYLEFLAEGSRIAVPHLQTPRAAIDWSFDLCSAQEQEVWARASEFVDGFDLGAAEAVCSGDGIDAEEILDLVAGLVDKSIFRRVNHEDMARYRMLEPIRQYGQERLASSGRRMTIRVRHLAHCRRLVEWAEHEWLGPNEMDWLARLHREHANLRTALEFCLTESGQERAGLEMLTSLWNYWFLSCFQGESRYWLDRALESNPQSSEARVKALWASGWVALLQSDFAVGMSMVQQCRSLAEWLCDESGIAHATRVSGVAALLRGDIPSAVRLFENALGRLREVGDRGGVWISLLHLAVTTAILGEPERAVAFGEECLALSDAGAHLSRSWAQWGLAIGRWFTGDRHAAGILIRESLRTSKRPFGSQWSVAHCLETLAWIVAADGHYRRAARLLGAADPIWRASGTRPAKLRYLTPSHDQCEERARGALGDENFATAFQEGVQLRFDEAIAYALESPL
jgi:non-specific serine/threonine protein kinase